MIALLLKGLILYVVARWSWRILRNYIVGSPLDKIPGPPPESLLIGNMGSFFDIDGWDYHKMLAEKYGNALRIKGVFGQSQLCISDPKAMHHVIVKDQNVFEETEHFTAMVKSMFGINSVLSTSGERHRRQRKMLNPVFSTAHMRQMVPIFWEVTNKLETTLSQTVQHGPQEIDILRWMTRTALELIGQSGFGFSFDPLTPNAVEHPFSSSIKMFVPTLSKLMFFMLTILPFASKIGTPRFRRFVVNALPWKDLHDMRDIADTLYNTSVEIFESKKKALKEGDEIVVKQIGQGKDIISILLKANMEASEGDRLSEDEMLSQISVFSFAAMDTTSSALARILHLLGTHPDVQDKLRDEILEKRKIHGNEIGYDELVMMPYLDAICRETMRLYPPVSMVRRIARQDISLPLSTPIKNTDGEEMNEIFVPKNTLIHVSILNSNRNPEIWGPDSCEWKPERWLNPLPDTVAEAHIPGIYSHLMTFLGGGRACIGFKFSQLEMKVVLAALIGSIKFSPSTSFNIKWNMAEIVGPVTVKEDKTDLRQQLPMVVTAV